MRQILKYILPAIALIAGLVSFTAAQAATYSEGIEYGLINPPLATQVEEGKIEVAEIFWYGCPHCYSLEPTIAKYLKQKPENVTFTRVPAMLGPKWSFHGKLYYVGLMLDPDGSKGVHSKIFEALHKQRRRIGNDDQLRRFFTGAGFKKDDINNALKSLEMDGKLDYAREMTAKSGLDSVPTVIVNGKYLTSPSMLSGKSLIELINYLTRLSEK